MFHKLSKIFWPRSVVPKDAVNAKAQHILSRSQKLMLDLGLIKPIGNGTFQITPIAQRSFDKCVALLTRHMNHVEGQKVTLSMLTPSKLWEKTGRLEEAKDELFLIREHESNKLSNILSPTHEESVTSLLAQSQPISYKQLPIKLYQIGAKFRDELKPRFGLLRTKEFIMKDLYSFDKSLEDAIQTYDVISQQYEKFFNSLQIPWIRTEADSGMMGGKLSHEYHIVSQVGEDVVLSCLNCGFLANDEVYVKAKGKCLKCESENLKTSKCIEIGHTFLLNDRYSKPLEANFLNGNGKPEALVMGCYGIGLSRLIAAALEVLSTDTELKWPTLLAPFDVCIIPPKEGSKEAEGIFSQFESIVKQIASVCDEDSILIDDRANLTIGKRLLDAKKMGYPNIIVMGSKFVEDEPKLELIQNNGNESQVLDLKHALDLLEAYRIEKIKLSSV